MKNRKKKWAYALAAAVLGISLLLAGCQGKEGEKELTKVTLSEVAHSIFYAPQYAAYELGYFEEEGIDLTIENAFGADKVMTALISGNADIGFAGSESSIYVYAQGQEDYAVNFAQLTQRAGNFLVSRREEPDFQWADLVGQTVLGGRAGDRHRSPALPVFSSHGFCLFAIPFFFLLILSQTNLHFSHTFSIHLKYRYLHVTVAECIALTWNFLQFIHNPSADGQHFKLFIPIQFLKHFFHIGASQDRNFCIR